MAKDVTELLVYQEALRLLKLLYELLKFVPVAEQDLIWQIKRAAQSIIANLAEGFAKRHFFKEFKRYLLIAIGSSDEVVTHLRMIAIAVPELNDQCQSLLSEYKILSKRLNALHKSWRFNSDPLTH